MTRKLLIGALCLLASAAVAGSGKYQPLNIKTGLWQITETYSVTGMPAGPHTITYKNCITQKDLDTNPFNDPEDKCTWTVLNSTGSDMEVRGGSCSLGREMDVKAAVHMKLHAVNSEYVKGSGEWNSTINGQPLTGNATGSGKWISATCSGQ